MNEVNHFKKLRCSTWTRYLRAWPRAHCDTSGFNCFYLIVALFIYVFIYLIIDVFIYLFYIWIIATEPFFNGCYSYYYFMIPCDDSTRNSPLNILSTFS